MSGPPSFASNSPRSAADRFHDHDDEPDGDRVDADGKRADGDAIDRMSEPTPGLDRQTEQRNPAGADRVERRPRHEHRQAEHERTDRGGRESARRDRRTAPAQHRPDGRERKAEAGRNEWN